MDSCAFRGCPNHPLNAKLTRFNSLHPLMSVIIVDLSVGYESQQFHVQGVVEDQSETKQEPSWIINEMIAADVTLRCTFITVNYSYCYC